MNYDLALNCNRCADFTEPMKIKDDPKTVFRCTVCGKKFSDDSIFFVDLDKEYKRSENGNLLEDLP